MKKLLITLFAFAAGTSAMLAQKKIAYIYGDVAEDGTIPSGGDPYDPMRLNDTGKTGISDFRDIVLADGHEITEHYDATTAFNASFFNSYDIVIFGLHQELLTASEKNALDTWLKAGGSILIYSDSAAGGKFNVAPLGSLNPVGQNAVNNITADYGMQVLLDQGGGNGGIPVIQSGTTSSHPIITQNLVIKGEGVSPVAIDKDDPNYSDFEILIPYTNDPNFILEGSALISEQGSMDIANPEYAALVIKDVGEGHIVGLFDRQPMWNNGVGANIKSEDNRLILTNVMKYLAGDLGGESEPMMMIEAEDFDDYDDSTPGNSGGDYRTTDVDINLGANGEYYVGWISSGEYLDYNVNIPEAGDYDFTFSVATKSNTNKTFHLESNGVDVSGPITFNTGGAGWESWVSVNANDITLPAGDQTLRIVMDSSSFNIDYFSIDGLGSEQEVENYLATNFSSESHPNDQNLIRDQGTKVGYIQDGTWISFDDFDFESGIDSIDIVASCDSAGGWIEVRVGSSTGTLIGTVPVTNTNGWDTFQTFSSNISADVSGVQDLYFVFTGASGYLLDIQSFSVSHSLTDLNEDYSATDFDSESHPSNQNLIRDQGSKVGYIQDGTWISFYDFNLGAGANSIDITASSGGSGGSIEVRLGSATGDLVGTVPVANTGGWNTFQTFSASLSSAANGLHDLYFVFTGGNNYLLDIQSFKVNQ